MSRRPNGMPKAAGSEVAARSSLDGAARTASRPSIHPLDGIDLRIVKELQNDATIPLALLADRVGLSQSPCWRRIQKLELAGILTRRVALADPTKLGLNLTAFVSVKAGDHGAAWRVAFAAALADLPEVVEVWRVAGEADYLLKVVTVDILTFDRFYRRLTSQVDLQAVSSQFTMERLVYDTALPIALERLEDREPRPPRRSVA